MPRTFARQVLSSVRLPLGSGWRQGLLLVGLCIAPVIDTAADVAPLRFAADVHGLTSAEAREGLPVELEAVVTHFHRKLGDGFFVQDETGGIYVRLQRLEIDLPLGERVRVHGITAPGDYAPVVALRSIEKLGPAPLPPARPVSAGALSSGRFDSMRIELRGVVTSVTPVERSNVPHLALQLRVDGQTVLAGVNQYTESSLDLADAEISVTGVAGGLFSRQRQLLRGVLLVESDEDIDVLRPPEPVEELPVQVIGDLFRFSPDGYAGHRVRVSGSYLGGPAGGWLAIRDGTGGVFVETAESWPDLQPGDVLDIAGFPLRRAQTLWLDHAQVLARRPGSPPEPTVTSFSVGLNRPGHLARMNGRIVGQPRPGDDAWVITLRTTDGNDFEAHVSPATDRYPSAWRDGAVVTVEGIAEAYTRPGQNLDLFPFPTALRIHVQSTDKIRLDETAPWHTSPDFALFLIGGLVSAGLLFAAVSVVAILLARKNAALQETRRRLQEAREELAQRFTLRTSEWRQELAARHAAEADFALLTAERTRLGRELHDTLEQSLASVGLQMDAVQGFYEKRPDKALGLLQEATRLLRESQAEVRRSVWNLRSLKLEETTLPDALEQLGKALNETQGPTITFRCVGEPVTLRPSVASHLFRIAQEAVTNALKHASARSIDLGLTFNREGVELAIVDDGQGFNPEQPVREGHFGLRGLRERAAALGVELEIDSRIGAGTRIRVQVPVTRTVNASS